MNEHRFICTPDYTGVVAGSNLEFIAFSPLFIKLLSLNNYIYQFFATDPDGREVEFQAFLGDVPGA